MALKSLGFIESINLVAGLLELKIDDWLTKPTSFIIRLIEAIINFSTPAEGSDVGLYHSNLAINELVLGRTEAHNCGGLYTASKTAGESTGRITLDMYFQGKDTYFYLERNKWEQTPHHIIYLLDGFVFNLFHEIHHSWMKYLDPEIFHSKDPEIRGKNEELANTWAREQSIAFYKYYNIDLRKADIAWLTAGINDYHQTNRTPLAAVYFERQKRMLEQGFIAIVDGIMYKNCRQYLYEVLDKSRSGLGIPEELPEATLVMKAAPPAPPTPPTKEVPKPPAKREVPPAPPKSPTPPAPPKAVPKPPAPPVANTPPAPPEPPTEVYESEEMAYIEIEPIYYSYTEEPTSEMHTPAPVAPTKNPTKDIPTKRPSTIEIADSMRDLWLSIAHHIYEKGGYDAGKFNNPGVVAEPIPVAHITDVVKYMDCVGPMGNYLRRQPVDDRVKGFCSKDGTLPTYGLYIQKGNQLRYYKLIPIRPDATDFNGNIKKTSLEVQQGHELAFLFDEGPFNATLGKVESKKKKGLLAIIKDRNFSLKNSNR